MKADRLLLSSETMAAIDRESRNRFGIPGDILMENAGRGVYERIAQHGPAPLVCLAGGGNNGGDAMVVARWAHIAGWDDIVVILGQAPRDGLPQRQLAILRALAVTVHRWGEDEERERCVAALERAAIVVDGLAGSGLQGDLREPALALAKALNGASAWTVSIDVPSGLHDAAGPDAPVVRADLTVVTGCARPAMYDPLLRHFCGEIRRVEPGFPPGLVEELAGERTAGLLAEDTDHPEPPRPEDHKTLRGRVLVVGGGPSGYGAPVLAALGARASGCGMIRLAGPPESAAAALAADPSIMTLPFPGGEAPSAELLAWADALVLGPGWTGATDAECAAWISAARSAGCALLIDASALGLLADPNGASLKALRAPRGAASPEAAPLVLTPHPGEWRRVQGALGREEVGIAAALVAQDPPPGEIWVVRGATTWISGPASGPLVLDGRCPALAHAGTGDLLAGLIAGSLARVAARGGPRDERAWTDAVVWAVVRHLHAGRQAGIDGGPESAHTLAQRLMEMPL